MYIYIWSHTYRVIYTSVYRRRLNRYIYIYIFICIYRYIYIFVLYIYDQYIYIYIPGSSNWCLFLVVSEIIVLFTWQRSFMLSSDFDVFSVLKGFVITLAYLNNPSCCHLILALVYPLICLPSPWRSPSAPPPVVQSFFHLLAQLWQGRTSQPQQVQLQWPSQWTFNLKDPAGKGHHCMWICLLGRIYYLMWVYIIIKKNPTYHNKPLGLT